MSALRPHPALASWLLPLFLLLLTAPAVADSITIGSATYIGWGSWGKPSKAMLTLQLDTRDLIFDRYILGLQYPLAFNVNVYGWMGKGRDQSTDQHFHRSTILLSVRNDRVYHEPDRHVPLPPG